MGETAKGAPEGLVVPVDLADKAYDVADTFSHLYGCDEEIRTKMTDAIGMALAQERESCAVTAETDAGSGDPSTIEAVANKIRNRDLISEPWADCIHISPERYRELLAIETPPVDFTIDPFETYYRNWRGEVDLRWIIPTRVWRGSTSWHPEPQWLLRAFDVNRQAERDFALKDFLPEGSVGTAAWGPTLEYKWYYADAEDAEYYPGSASTRDAAFEDAKDYYAGDAEPNAETGRTELSFVLIEGAKEPLRLARYITIGAVLDDAEEAVLEGEQATEDDEGPFFQPSKEMVADLERRIKVACDEWQVANDFYPMTRCVSAVRNCETVTIDVTADEASAAAEEAEK